MQARNQLQTDQNGIKGYFSEIFEYLLTMHDSTHNSMLALSSFHKYFNLPLIVSQKMFNVLDSEKKDSLTREQFVNGFYEIYFGTLDQKFEIIFSILDFSQTGLIQKEDAHLILSHLNLTECLLTSTILEEILNDVYGAESSLSKELFGYKSDLFFLMNYLISRAKPFHEESINYYKDLNLNRWYEAIESGKVSECKSPMKKKSKFFSSTSIVPFDNQISRISDPSEKLLKYINGSNFIEEESEILLEEFDCLEKFEGDKESFLIVENSLDIKSFSNGQNVQLYHKTVNKHVNSINSSKKEKSSESTTPVTQEISSSNNSQCVNPSPLSPIKNSQNRRNSDASVSDISAGSSSFSQCKSEVKEILVLSLHQKDLRTMKLVLIYNDIFCFKLTRAKKVFKLFKIITLRCSMIIEGEPVKIKNNTYYPIQIVTTYGGKSSKTIDFFSEDQSEIHTFMKQCKQAAGQRKILEAYEIKTDIGKGQFGKVKLGISKSTGEKVAIKILKKSNITKKAELEMVHWEIDIFKFLKHARHPGIINSIDFYESVNSYYFVYEYATGGCLTKYLYAKKDYLSISELKCFACQMGEAIDFLHQYGIVHRDIKPDNILVQKYSDHSVKLKLIDFGLSKVIGRNESTTESYGSLCYTCPEVLSSVPYNHKADVWSFGVLLYYLRYGILPFDDENDLKNIRNKILCASFIFPVDSQTSHNESDFGSVINKCLQSSPAKRKTLREVLTSKWFKSF